MKPSLRNIPLINHQLKLEILQNRRQNFIHLDIREWRPIQIRGPWTNCSIDRSIRLPCHEVYASASGCTVNVPILVPQWACEVAIPVSTEAGSISSACAKVCEHLRGNSRWETAMCCFWQDRV